MNYLRTVVVSVFLSSCVSVGGISESSITDVNYRLAENAYNAGDFTLSERIFKAFRDSESLDYQLQTDSVIYWIASAGRLGKLPEVQEFLDSNHVDRNVTIPGGLLVDLGFDVSDIQAWGCHLLGENVPVVEKAECWSNAGYTELAKSTTIDAIVHDYSNSRVIEFGNLDHE